MLLHVIARKIGEHLRQIEKLEMPEYPLFMAGASAAGRYVSVTYVSYQGNRHLTKAEAERYLAWLDAGNMGRHTQMDREATNAL